MIGVVNLVKSLEGDYEMSYKLYKAPKLKNGYSIKAGLVY
jgi:hypothetical protein